jgi:polysaccharide biosynthesis protein PslG
MSVRLLRTVFASLLMLDVAQHAGAQVRPEYFGLHIHRAHQSTKWPEVPFGSWRLWDADVSWRDIEPAPNQFDFTRLDQDVALARRHGVDVLLPLALTPTWASARPAESSAYGPGHAAMPARMEDWTHYVETVARRYAGLISAYEIWNEPDLSEFFSGSLQDMITLSCAAYGVIKRVDPAALVLSPSGTGQYSGIDWFERFVSQGGRECFDIIGFHFYVLAHEQPEAMSPLIAAMRDRMAALGLSNVPLWNTESGWYIQNRGSPVLSRWKVWDDRTVAAFVSRALILGVDEGLERFYWYSWDNHQMGLLEPDGTLKRSALAYAQTYRWLIGGSALKCQRELDQNVFVCDFVSDKQRKHLVWSLVAAKRFTVPRSWRATRYERLLERERGLPQDATLLLEPTPMLVH